MQRGQGPVWLRVPIVSTILNAVESGPISSRHSPAEFCSGEGGAPSTGPSSDASKPLSFSQLALDRHIHPSRSLQGAWGWFARWVLSGTPDTLRREARTGNVSLRISQGNQQHENPQGVRGTLRLQIPPAFGSPRGDNHRLVFPPAMNFCPRETQMFEKQQHFGRNGINPQLPAAGTNGTPGRGRLRASATHQAMIIVASTRLVESIRTHFYPLRAEMGCKSMQMNEFNCNARKSRIH